MRIWWNRTAFTQTRMDEWGNSKFYGTFSPEFLVTRPFLVVRAGTMIVLPDEALGLRSEVY